jgi:cytochrome c oxidase subunit 2
VNTDKASRLVLIGGGILVSLVVAACMWPTSCMWPGPRFGGQRPGGVYRSNGEQIYVTATSQRGTPITSDMGTGMMGGGMMTCAQCHGADGRGGRARMMMQTFEAPDIRYCALTAEEHHEDEGMEHEPFTDETIKQAITKGIEPDSESLEWPMPRWSMTEADLDDLLEFLKTLSCED